MKKSTILILSLCGLLFISSGCNTYKKQLTRFQGFALQHKTELAKLCTEVFPVKDSVGKSEIIYNKAENKDYRPLLDSLKHSADSLSEELKKVNDDKSNPCKTEIANYAGKVQSLQARINSILNGYTKCRPDTIKILTPVYRVDNAALNVAETNFNTMRDSVHQVNGQLKQAKEEISSKQKSIWILIASLVVLGVSFLLKMLGKF